MIATANARHTERLAAERDPLGRDRRALVREAGLLSVGHGTHDRAGLGALLTGAGVELVVDVRRFPGSRTHPDLRRETLGEWLPAAGIHYRWEQRLGGRRTLPPGEPVADDWWTVTQFAAYAAHTRTPEFGAALDQVLTEAARSTVAVMCSESVWWRCHRRLIADVAVLGRGVPVQHLMPDGRLAAHRPSEGAVVGPDGTVRWPATPGAGSGGRSAGRTSP